MKSLIMFLFVLSCSSWDREKCLTTDWYQKGVEDASSEGKGDFQRYKSACAEEGVSVAGAASKYQQGLNVGMRSFCTYQNGYALGVEGKNASAACHSINPAFGRGLEDGHREFRIVEQRKREEEDRQKRYQDEVEDFKRKVFSTSDTKECYVDSDCRKSDHCTFNRCQHSGRSCDSSMDCEVRGRCDEVSQHANYGPRIRFKVCDYGRW